MSETSLKKNLSYTTIGMVLYNFAIWVFSALILRMLGPESSGYYAIACSIGNSLYAVSLWGMRSFVVADTKDQYSYQEYFTARISAILITIVILLGILLFSSYSPVQREILILYTLFKCSEALIEIIDCFCQKKKRMEINAYSMMIRSITFIIVFYLSLRFFHSMNLAFILLILLALCIFLFVNYRSVKKFIPLSFHLSFNQRVKEILIHSFPIMAFEMLSAWIVALPRLRFEAIGDTSALGIYTSIYTMIVFLQLVINVLIYTFAPYMATAYAKNEKKEFSKYVWYLFLGAIGLGLLAEGLVFFLGEFVIGLFFGPLAKPYYTYLYLGILSGVTLTFTWIVSQIFVIYQKRIEQCLCAIIALIACFILSRWFVIPTDCNSISLVTIYANIVFLVVALAMLWLQSQKK